MTKEQEIIAEKLESLSRKVDILTAVTAASILQGKNNTDKVSVLLEIGLKPHEIGTILSIPQNSVRAIKSKLSKKNQEKTKVLAKNKAEE
jgi:hypothetical protein